MRTCVDLGGIDRRVVGNSSTALRARVGYAASMALAMGFQGVARVAAAVAIATGCAGSSGVDTGDATTGGDSSAESTAQSTAQSTASASTTVPDGDTTIDDPSQTTNDVSTTPEACDDSSGAFDLGDPDGGGTSGGSAEDTNGGMGGDIPIGATVFAVRQGDFDAGTLVEVENLVVTAPIADNGGGSFVFVQATDGGEYSAIVLVVSTPVTDIAIGTRVRVVGRVARLDDLSRIVVDGDVEEIIPEGEAPVPAPFVITLAELDDPSLDLLPYDAALVRVELPEVTDDPACPGEFSLAAELRVDDLFLGEDAPSPAAGSAFSAILGPLRYTTTGYEIAPRSLDDLIE